MYERAIKQQSQSLPTHCVSSRGLAIIFAFAFAIANLNPKLNGLRAGKVYVVAPTALFLSFWLYICYFLLAPAGVDR